jgi:multiple sugar transport system substrate-binding protein
MKKHAPQLWRLILLLGLTISACGTGIPSPSPTQLLSTTTRTTGPTPSITREPTPTINVNPAALRGISVKVWHAFSGEADLLFADRVAQFNSDNEWGIVVTPAGYGDYTTLFDTVNAVLGSGNSPALVAALPEQTLSWDASGSVVDLSPYLGDKTWGVASDFISSFQPVFWAQDTLDGRQLGLPAQRSARFLFYNQTWARQLGFANPPASADEFRQQACAANASFLADTSPQNDGYGGWIVDTDWQTLTSWLLAFGGGVVAPVPARGEVVGNSYVFHTQPNLAALQFLKSLYDDHCAWILDAATPYDAFAGRSALFFSANLAEASLVKESMSRQGNHDEWTLLPFPGVDTRILVSYGPSYSLLKSSPEMQLAAWLFTRWMLSPGNQARWVEETGLFPLGNSVTGLTGTYRTESPQWEAAVRDLPLARGLPQLASWRKVRYVLQDGVQVIFQTNLPLNQIPSILDEMDFTAHEISTK